LFETLFLAQVLPDMLFQVPSLPPAFVDVVAEIDRLRADLRYQTSDTRRRWTGLLRRSTFARAVQGSNSIEGYHVTQDDAMAAVDDESPFDAQTEAWMAVSGYRSAMSYVLQLANDPHYQHNLGTINSLHYMMVGFDLKSNPGRLRPGAVWIRNEASGDIVYEGPDIATVPALLAELVESMNAASPLPVMVRAALAHLNLVMIHPYSDGNGRMARALQSMVLAREGILDPTFSSIEEYLGRHTTEYYRVLGDVGQGAWHPQNDPMPWVRFCLTAHYQQATLLLRRTREINDLWSLLEAEVAARKLNDRMIVGLADAAIGLRVRNSGYRKANDVSEQVAGNDLRTLVEQGLLVPKGEKRARVYVASDRLLEMRQRTRVAQAATVDPFELVARAG
jgi:Fic family protein